jgi:hypothetical protein
MTDETRIGTDAHQDAAEDVAGFATKLNSSRSNVFCVPAPALFGSGAPLGLAPPPPAAADDVVGFGPGSPIKGVIVSVGLTPSLASPPVLGDSGPAAAKWLKERPGD